MSEFARVAGIALLAVLAQSPQPAQPSLPAQQPPHFRGGTSLVRVDALATSGGIPVQDLTVRDFTIFEDGVPQKIETFEHIVISAAPPSTLVDPSSPSQAVQQAGDPHRRVFVIYLDGEHVDFAGSQNIKEPLIEFMNRLMSDDDLVGVMTPEMGAQQITFARKTDVVARGLRENWAWGRRDTVMLDARETLYDQCYPKMAGEESGNMSALATAMALRRREKMVLDSLHDLARYMEVIRDGRTAVIAVSGGWPLYGPNPRLVERRKTIDGRYPDPAPGTPPPVGVGRAGTLMTRPENTGNSSTNPNREQCEEDRHTLADLDDKRYLTEIVGEANRANLSFYTIDPRFDTSMDQQPYSQLRDDPRLDPRVRSLMTLAADTNGIFLFNTADLRARLRNVADDLSSYYLIGYYSTNTKLDGRYRTITVRSTRSGVDVRARQGYRAASAREVNAARAAADVPVDEEKTAITRALGAIESDARAQGRPLARGPDEPALFHRGPATGNQMQPATGRIFPRSDRLRLEIEAAADSPPWAGALLDRNGRRTAVPVSVGERTDAASGQRWLTADITLAPLGAGDYVIELTTTIAATQRRTLVAIRVTQ